MDSFILSILSVVMFCLCAHQLLKAMLTPVPLLASQRPYARGAMYVGKSYKVIAWGMMTFAFMLGLIVSFYQVYSSL